MPISDTLIQTVSSAMKPFPPMIPPTPFLSASCDSAHGAQSYLRLSECEFLIVSAFWGTRKAPSRSKANLSASSLTGLKSSKGKQVLHLI